MPKNISPKVMSILVVAALVVTITFGPDTTSGSDAHLVQPTEESIGTKNPGRRAASVALAQVGTRYGWGGNGPSAFDCSGLVGYAAKQQH